MKGAEQTGSQRSVLAGVFPQFWPERLLVLRDYSCSRVISLPTRTLPRHTDQSGVVQQAEAVGGGRADRVSEISACVCFPAIIRPERLLVLRACSCTRVISLPTCILQRHTYHFGVVQQAEAVAGLEHTRVSEISACIRSRYSSGLKVSWYYAITAVCLLTRCPHACRRNIQINLE